MLTASVATVFTLFTTRVVVASAMLAVWVTVETTLPAKAEMEPHRLSPDGSVMPVGSSTTKTYGLRLSGFDSRPGFES